VTGPPDAQPVAGLRHLYSGKVRELYQLADGTLMLVATDRISAYDHVLPTLIPDKGKILTQLSLWWFEQLADLVPNHLLDVPVPARFAGRAVACQRLSMIGVECVARGYLAGSGWRDYQRTGAVCGVTLPAGLTEGDRLPEPIFTPATKAQSGHDINISEADAARLVGRAVLDKVKALTLRIYAEGAAYADTLGIIIADTKLEFGILPGAGRPEDRIILIDEVLTPDSSRFWPRDGYEPGGAQPSFDKQFVRDYLESIKWNKLPPVPSLPPDVIEKTRDKYLEAYRRLTGKELE